jgi:GntR family transcriptional regulator, transcriptional repressor for pyruvate dehydrogenase complex
MDEPGGSDRNKYLYNQIVEQIEQMIQRGELKVGDRLPPERTLARTFRVSRNCIRQAIQALSAKTILESRRGDGTYVCAADQGLLVSSLAQAIQTQKDLLKDIIEFRLLMEPQIAYLAARNITREELDRLKVIVCDQERKNLAGQEDVELDAAFHLQLAEASKNRIIHQVVSTMNEILNESRSEFLQTDGRRRNSVIGHLKIIDALEAGDPQRAFQAMREHLLAVERSIFGAHPGGAQTSQAKG